MIAQQVQHQVGCFPADTQLGLPNQGQVREDLPEEFQFIEPDNRQIIRYADAAVLQGQHGAQGHLEIGDEQGSGPLLQHQQNIHLS